MIVKKYYRGFNGFLFDFFHKIFECQKIIKKGYINLFLFIVLVLIGGCKSDNIAQAPSIKLGAYYFDGWAGKCPYDDGTTANAWAKGMPSHYVKLLGTDFSGRKPIWGWRDDTMEIMEKQINLASENGISYFAFDWYWHDTKLPINVDEILKDSKNSSLQMFMVAKNNTKMQFCLLVANHTGSEIVGTDAWKQAANYWIKTYFKHPRYLLVDGKPLVIIFSPLGADKDGLTYLQEAARNAGFPGVLVAECGTRSAADGFQIQAVYNVHSADGIGVDVTYPFQKLMDINVAQWIRTDRQNMLYIPTITAGWDKRPCEIGTTNLSPHYDRGTPAELENYVQRMVNWMKAYPGQVTKDKLAMIYAWNEYSEGGWITPCAEDPDGSYLKAIRHVVLGK